MIKRCFGSSSEIYSYYHDYIWGKPVHDDRILFKMLVLESFQAGLSFETILKKEKILSMAFDDFDYHKVANYDEEKINSIFLIDGMIKNRAKVRCTINNALRFLEVIKEFGSFDNYIWHFTNYKTIDHHLKKLEDMPISNELSDEICKDMKRRGFKFIGTIIIYSYLQSIGIINDHLDDCIFR